MKRRTCLALGMFSLPFSGCSGAGSSDNVSNSEPSTSLPPPLSRGYQASTVDPRVLTSADAQLAVEFVKLAATPDSRLDAMPPDAVLRARAMMTQQLAAKITVMKRPLDDPQWETRWGKEDDYIAINITNVIGDTPQAAPAPNEPTPNPENGTILEVMFNQVHHHNGIQDHLPEGQAWMVIVHNGLITYFSTSLQ